MASHFLFVDDAIEPHGDAERYRVLLTGDDLVVTAVAPMRETLLVPEKQLVPEAIDGFILDINLQDYATPGGQRFIGTGAGLAQDLRLLQAIGGEEGQRPRPIVRLCAAQVFQKYLAGDNSTAEVFDLGFDKQTIADTVHQARKQIAALPDIYEGFINAENSIESAAVLVGLSNDDYQRLHSSFRSSFSVEIGRKVHEAASFFLDHFILSPGLLIDERLLAARLGVDITRGRSPGWTEVVAMFDVAKYSGRGSNGFSRWWMNGVLAAWAGFDSRQLYSLTAEQRCEVLVALGRLELMPLSASERNPGDRPWFISPSDQSELQLPTDPNFGYSLNAATKPWLDETLWCFEQAKQQRKSPQLSDAVRARLERDIKSKSVR